MVQPHPLVVALGASSSIMSVSRGGVHSGIGHRLGNIDPHQNLHRAGLILGLPQLQAEKIDRCGTRHPQLLAVKIRATAQARTVNGDLACHPAWHHARLGGERGHRSTAPSRAGQSAPRRRIVISRLIEPDLQGHAGQSPAFSTWLGVIPFPNRSWSLPGRSASEEDISASAVTGGEQRLGALRLPHPNMPDP